MRFLNRTHRAAAPPASANDPGPAPAILAPLADGTNPLHRLLDDSRLPWRAPRAQVETRTGIVTDPYYTRDTLLLTDAARPPGFLQPWQADVFERYAPDLPVVRFRGLAWFEADAAANVARIAAHFAGTLGPASIGRRWNTLVCGWQAGTAALQLMAWPPAWQSHGLENSAHAREPRVATACHVTLLTGFRLPLNPEEERWVLDFQPVAATGTTRSPADTAPGETEIEYARDPAGYLPALQDRIGHPPGREALIVCTHQLFVVPARDLLGFEVLRLLPAKGGGGSTLSVRCRTSCPGIAYKTLQLAQHRDPDGVTTLGQALAAAFGTHCVVEPYIHDV